MRLALWGCFVVVTASVAAGCGPTCQDTCRRFYEEDQCNAPPQGIPRDDQIASCLEECNAKLLIPGDAPIPGSKKASLFDPNVLPSTEVRPVLDNEQDVGLWMDCVWSFEEVEQCRSDIVRSCARVP